MRWKLKRNMLMNTRMVQPVVDAPELKKYVALPKNKELIVRIRIFTLLSFIMNVIINCKTQKKIPMIFSKYFAKIIFKGQDLLLKSIQIACIFKLRLIHYTFFSLFPSFRNLNLMLICYSPNAHFTNFEDACDTSLCYH